MDTQLIPAKTVRCQCGKVSDMTLWRWLNNPKFDFPQPIYIAGRRYWRQAQIDSWVNRQDERGAA